MGYFLWAAEQTVRSLGTQQNRDWIHGASKKIKKSACTAMHRVDKEKGQPGKPDRPCHAA
ncbi:MAG: hypothetical protein ACI83N_002100 [Hydrogenophaga sp.]|jgi:hypothetical protein